MTPKEQKIDFWRQTEFRSENVPLIKFIQRHFEKGWICHHISMLGKDAAYIIFYKY